MRTVITDFDGYGNTQKIRNFGNVSNYPAVYAVDFANGWYLPAMGQLRMLYGNLIEVNASLVAVGGTTLFETNSLVHTYWSSSEYSSNRVWTLDASGYVDTINKDSDYNSRARVRSVSVF